MRLATIQDRKEVIKVLQKAFLDNPTMQLLTKKRNREKHIGRVIRYAFDFAHRRKGVFISNNGKGAVICYVYNSRKKNIMDFIGQLKLVITAMPFRRMLNIFLHNLKVNRSRPKSGNFLYVWFLGVDPEEKPRISPAEFKRDIFRLAQHMKLDIYAETTRKDLKIGYERMGFKVYKEWYNAKCNVKVWFLKRPFYFSSPPA